MRNKFLIGIFLLAVATVVFSQSNTLGNYEPGFYLGVQGGYARIYEGGGVEDYMRQISRVKEINKGKWGGRLFIGYSFAPIIGLETGYTYYPQNFYKINSCDIKIGFITTMDLVVKGILPLEYFSAKLAGWNLFGKLGAAIGANNDKDSVANKSFIGVRPAYGLGIGYNFTNHFGVDMSWFGIYSHDRLSAKDVHNVFLSNPSSKIHFGIPRANLVAIGVYYKF